MATPSCEWTKGRLLCLLLAVVIFGSHLLLINYRSSLQKILAGMFRQVQPLCRPQCANLGTLSGNRLSLAADAVTGERTTCYVGTPFEYKTELDFRVIVLTHNRPASLRKTLDSIAELDMMGDRLAVEIWVDRSIKGEVDDLTLETANDWIRTWRYRNGTAQLHVQDKHAGIRNQWIYTWRPHVNSSREIGLMLEDDIDVSPYAYRWLKAVHREYGDCPSVSGYTLQMENVYLKAIDVPSKALHAPQNDSTFMYPITGTWGYSPHPVKWRLFQDWYTEVIQRPGFHPYVEGIVSTQWFKDAERHHQAQNTWVIYHHYFNYIEHFYCVYSNLRSYTGRKDVLLSHNRLEDGLHYRGKATGNVNDSLMRSWEDSYVRFPEQVKRFQYNGSVARLG